MTEVSDDERLPGANPEALKVAKQRFIDFALSRSREAQNPYGDRFGFQEYTGEDKIDPSGYIVPVNRVTYLVRRQLETGDYSATIRIYIADTQVTNPVTNNIYGMRVDQNLAAPSLPEVYEGGPAHGHSIKGEGPINSLLDNLQRMADEGLLTPRE